VLLLALAAAAGTPAAAGRSGEGIPRFGHVFLIIGENTTYSHLKPSNAPYLLTRLRPRSAWLANYLAATHWSQANYVALTSGQFTRCEQQDYGVSCHQDVNNIFHQVDLGGQTWRTWLEGGTAKCDTGSGGSCEPQGNCPLTGFYTTGNPAILYDDIEGANGVWSATNRSQECLQNDLSAGDPLDIFHHALRTGDVGNYNLILPNGCEDGEANCKPVNNRYTQFDNFLAREVPRIMASPAYGRDGVIVITYDEDERAGGLAKKHGLGSGGHVACAIISPLVAAGNYTATTYSYGLLRTIEDGLRLGGHVGHAADVPAFTGIWRTS
jgi:phosphatidylinositol-3-phosphatase